VSKKLFATIILWMLCARAGNYLHWKDSWI